MSDRYQQALLARARNRSSRVIKEEADTQGGCDGCHDPEMKYHNKRRKKSDGELLQTVRGNPALDWRDRFDHPDSFTHENYLERMGKVQGLVRDNPLVRGSLKNERAHVIGPNVRLSYEPDYNALGLDIDWQRRAAETLEDGWERDMEDPVYCWNDASGDQTISGQFGTAFFDAQSSGAILGLFYAEDKPKDRPISFSVGLIDVARLSNPPEYDTDPSVRGGQRINARGRTTTYYISSELPTSCYGRFSSFIKHRKQLTWKPVRPFNRWGSPQIFHWFDKERPDQSRGVPDLASALKRSHMHETYEDTIIDAAIRDAAFALWVESNSPNVGQAFATNPGMKPGEFVEEVLGQRWRLAKLTTKTETWSCAPVRGSSRS